MQWISWISGTNSISLKYVKNQVPALCPLSGLFPRPGEMMDPHLGMSLPGDKVSNICFFLENLSWLVDERVSVQRSAGSHKSDYLAIYRSHFSNKMDISVFSDPKPKKLPQAPKRLRYISSYRSSLRSLRYVGRIKTARGRFSRRYRPKGQARIGDAPKLEKAASSQPREQSPEIWVKKFIVPRLSEDALFLFLEASGLKLFKLIIWFYLKFFPSSSFCFS